MSLITNPEALFATDQEKAELINQVKEYIKQYVRQEITESDKNHGQNC